jgi:hypothetical protein
MLALDKNATGKVTALCNAIDPGHGVFLRTRAGKCDELFQPYELGGLIPDAPGSDGAQLHFSPTDQAGQPHPPDGSGVPFRIFGCAAHHLRPIRTYELEAWRVQSERARNMMIFAVDVVGNRSTDGYVFGARAHRQKPAAGHSEVQNLGQRHSSFAAQQTGLLVERDQAIKIWRAQQCPILEQANVAVTASHAHRQHFFAGDPGRRKILFPEEGADFSGEPRIAAPGFKVRPILAIGHKSIIFPGELHE